MKNIFENAEIELVFFEAGDVMTTSAELESPPFINDNQTNLGGGNITPQHE